MLSRRTISLPPFSPQKIISVGSVELRRLILAVLYLAMMLASVGLSLIFYRRGGRSIILASIAFAAFGTYVF
jgi:hypothetical protein